MMTCLFSVSSDHGRAGRERPRPCLGRPHSILWSHQDRHGGIHLSVHQNIPEQNLPRVPGQEVTQEKCQKLDSIAGANPPVRGRRRGRERGRRRRRRRDKSTESSLFLSLLSALCPAVIMPIILLTHSSVNCSLRAVGRVRLGATLFLLGQCGSTNRSPASGCSISTR